MALSSVDTNKWRPLLARDWAPPLSGKNTSDVEGPRPLRQQQRRLTEVEIARMVDRYAAGATVYELADEYGIERRTVSVRLKAAGAIMRRQPPSADQISEMVRFYVSGLSLERVGERTGFSSKTVHTYLKNEGIRLRDSHGRERT